MGTMGMARITIVTHLQEYNTYSRVIRQQPNAPDRKGARGQAVLRNWIFGGRQYESGSYYLLEHTFRNIICILEPLDSSQMPPVERVLEGRQFFAVEFIGVGHYGHG